MPKPKKILICGYDPVSMASLELELIDKGHRISKLLHPSSPDSVVTRL